MLHSSYPEKGEVIPLTYEILNNPGLGVVLTIGAYMLAMKLYTNVRWPILNANIIGSIMLIMLLDFSGLPYEFYKEGGKYIAFLLELTMIALAVPIYKNLHLIKKNASAIFLGILCGAVVGIISSYIFSLVFGANGVIAVSIAPKSVTTPISKGICTISGGVPAVTHATAVASGIVGMTIGPFFLRIIGVKHPIAQGLALGTGSHGLGTSRAVEEGEIEGAISSLAMGIAGIITSLAMPFFLKLIKHIH